MALELEASELEFRNVDFCGGRKTGEPGEKPSEQGRVTNNKLNLGFETGPHWWEASAIITAPSLLFLKSKASKDISFFLVKCDVATILDRLNKKQSNSSARINDELALQPKRAIFSITEIGEVL